MRSLWVGWLSGAWYHFSPDEWDLPLCRPGSSAYLRLCRASVGLCGGEVSGPKQAGPKSHGKNGIRKALYWEETTRPYFRITAPTETSLTAGARHTGDLWLV